MKKKNMFSIIREAADAELFNDEEQEKEYDGYEENDDDDLEEIDDEYEDEEFIEEDLEDEDYYEDLHEISDEEIEAVKNEIIDSYSDMDEIDEEELEYTEEMVTVIENHNGEYLVEYDNLAKLMKSSRCDACTAMTKISECNNLPLSNMVLVVESNKSMLSLVNEKAVSKKSKKKKLVDMKASMKLLQNMKNEGIKIVKKKSKKLKSKKRR